MGWMWPWVVDVAGGYGWWMWVRSLLVVGGSYGCEQSAAKDVAVAAIAVAAAMVVAVGGGCEW